MHKYRLVAKKGEGTFSEVLKAQCIKNGKYVAIKCMKNHFDSLDQVNNLREIQALRRLSPHPHIIQLLEVLYDQPTGRLALVFELMDMNIYELIRGRRHYVAEDRVRSYLYQLMKSLDHMHRNGIFHRDIKPENILIMDDCLKLADFGSCRGIYSKQPYTEYISTRWYRAPECLLTDGYYNYKMDMWGVGCVMFEVVALYPLFPGNNELDQIQKIHAIMGTPPPELLAKLKKRSCHSSSFDFPACEGSGLAKLLSHVHPECADLISKLLAYNPDERLSARQALRHPYFRDLWDQEKRLRAAMQPDIAGSYLAMDSDRGSHATAAMGQALSADGLLPAGSGLSELQADAVQQPALSSFTTAMRVSNGAPAAAAEHAGGGAAAGKSLPAITGSSMKVHGHGQQQQQGSHPMHHQHLQQQPQQQQQQALQQQLEGLHITGAATMRDKEGSLGLLAGEVSAASAALHVPGLGVQASMDSIWEEGSEMIGAAAGSGPGQLLPPLLSKAAAASHQQQQAQQQAQPRRSSYLGQGTRQQPPQQGSSIKAAAAAGSHHHAGQGYSNHSHSSNASNALAAKASMMQSQAARGAAAGNPGIQVSSAR
ncbi:hypothetical protein OEZ85_011589 [Tetradesmus obliquus]|uniref:Protein kinase domain-containing protein n=1 Tax=Tetradesmus obliquus TaxID=3088 RepID=A0ABY8TQX4_TETOB|nr:hypothetical protein OEZ85_011589 [Tetradesmus obliquus]